MVKYKITITSDCEGDIQSCIFSMNRNRFHILWTFGFACCNYGIHPISIISLSLKHQISVLLQIRNPITKFRISTKSFCYKYSDCCIWKVLEIIYKFESVSFPGEKIEEEIFHRLMEACDVMLSICRIECENIKTLLLLWQFFLVDFQCQLWGTGTWWHCLDIHWKEKERGVKTF